MTRWLLPGLLGLSLLALLGLPACQEGKQGRAPAPAVPVPDYGDGPDELRRLWTDTLHAAQKDDRGRVHDFLAAQIMTQQELTELFGSEQAQKLWPRYQVMMGSLANSGAVELVGQVYEKKLDDVSVLRVDQQPRAEIAPPDQAVLSAFVRPVPLYAVRLKRKAEQKGLRYDFFVYRDGHWRTGNFLGKELAPQATPAGAQQKGVDLGRGGP